MTDPTLINVYTGHSPCSAAILTGKDWHKMRHTPDKQDNKTYVRTRLTQMFACFVIYHQSFKQSDSSGMLCNGFFSSCIMQCLTTLCQFNQPKVLGSNKGWQVIITTNISVIVLPECLEGMQKGMHASKHLSSCARSIQGNFFLRLNTIQKTFVIEA